jgi:uncharacterized membrane protein
MRNMSIRLASIFVFGGCLTASPQAHAWVKVCNQRPAAINVAAATTPKDAPGTSTGGDRGVTVEGWIGVGQGQCATVSDNRATDIELYIYVASNGGPIGGTSRLCVRQQPFKNGQQFLHQGQTCKPPWSERGFQRVEMDKPNWTETIKP